MDDYTTAVDTRSLSVTSVASAPSNTTSILYSALLYYENPNGKVSVLLLTHQNALTGPLWSNQCINITSQESKSLPDEFRNIPGNGLSKTLYESQTLATFSTPFTSGGNFSGSSQGALFYSPSGSRSISGIDSSVHDDLIMSSVYMVGPSGPGVFNSNEEGIYCASSWTEWLFRS